MVKIYVLIDPFTQQKRYLGVTERTTRRRLYEHIWGARNTTKRTHKNNWIRSIVVRGKTPFIQVVDQVLPDNAADAESLWISKLKSEGCKLTNGTLGGEWCVKDSRLSDATRAIMSQKAIDRFKTGKNPMLGKTHTKEAKALQSEKAKLRVGAKNNNAKALYQYDIEGNFIRAWDYAKEAADTLNISRGNLSSAATYNTNKAADQPYKIRGGYVFKFTHEIV